MRNDINSNLDRPVVAARAGLYHTATTPTWGTGVPLTSATRTTFLESEVAVLIEAKTVPAGVYVVPDFALLKMVSGGANTTSIELGLIASTNQRFQEFGVELTPHNTHTGYATSSAARIALNNGDLATSAPVGARQILRTTAWLSAAPVIVAGDRILVKFGDAQDSWIGITSGTGGSRMAVIQAPPVVLKPGSSLAMHLWCPGMTSALVMETTFGWVER